MQAQKKTQGKASFSTQKTGLLQGVIFAFLFTVFAAGALLLIGALILSRCTDGTVYIKIIGCVLSAALAFLGGLIAGKRVKHTGALSGLLFGVLYLALLLILGSLFGGGEEILKRLVIYTVLLLLATLGGAAGAMQRNRPRHKRHRR